MTPQELFDKNIEKFDFLIKFFQEENEKINLSSFNDYDSIKSKHIIDSLNIFQFDYWKNLFNKSNFKIADIGTGGGFPGLVLAILLPNHEFYLIDSITKKCNAVSEIAKKLNLSNVQVINDRAENLKIEMDITVSRAVSEFKNIFIWSKNITKQEGRIYLFKSHKEEISDFNDKIVYSINEDKRVIYEFLNKS